MTDRPTDRLSGGSHKEVILPKKNNLHDGEDRVLEPDGVDAVLPLGDSRVDVDRT